MRKFLILSLFLHTALASFFNFKRLFYEPEKITSISVAILEDKQKKKKKTIKRKNKKKLKVRKKKVIGKEKEKLINTENKKEKKRIQKKDC